MLEEFKKFVLRGNVIDLAVGFIMGAAFSKIVTSLVNDVIMPPSVWRSARWIFPICSLTYRVLQSLVSPTRKKRAPL